MKKTTKILYAIQGTGNGHLTRARDVYPELLKYGEVDILVSGIQGDVALPFPVKYQFYGLSFIFGKKGGVSIWQTIKRMKLIRLIKNIRQLPVHDYDLVINDFEPISAWACRSKKINCVSLSHQCAVLHEKANKPKRRDFMGWAVLKYYAPVNNAYGFHFKKFAANIFTPVIRQEIRNLRPTDEGHYTVYLPAYDDATLIKNLSVFKNVQWEVFSKHNKEAIKEKNVSIRPIENDAFIKSMASSSGVLCGAGFEGPAEAMFLGKKLMVIPMLAQYEQQCNAATLESMKVPVLKVLDKKYYNTIKWWLMAGEPVKVDYPDITADIVKRVVVENTLKETTTKKILEKTY